MVSLETCIILNFAASVLVGLLSTQSYIRDNKIVFQSKAYHLHTYWWQYTTLSDTRIFHSCDLDLDPMTFIYTVTWRFGGCICIPEVNFLGQGFHKLEHRFIVWQPRRAADVSTNWRQSLFCCCTASMEQAIDRAETAAINGLVSSRKIFLFYSVYRQQDTDWLCDVPSVF